LSLRSIDAIIIIQPKIDCLPYQDNSAGRKRLASDCYDRVLEGNRKPIRRKLAMSKRIGAAI